MSKEYTTMVSAMFVTEGHQNEDVATDWRILLFERENTTGDTLEAFRYGEGFCLTIDNPWAGSTEDGFGMNTSINLTLEQLEHLVAWARQAKDVEAT